MMIEFCNSSKCVIMVLLMILHRAQWVMAAASICEYSFRENKKLFSYTLASPLPHFPHGVLSEDGYSSLSLSELVLDLGIVCIVL